MQGKHDGTVQGVRYFTCQPKRGIFVRPKSLKVSLLRIVKWQLPTGKDSFVQNKR